MKSQFYLAVNFLIATVIILMISIACVFAQQGNLIKGKVLDEMREPIPGAHIIIKGTNIQGVSDANGVFSIQVPNRESVLIVSFIGYVSQEIRVGDRKELEILLAEDTQA